MLWGRKTWREVEQTNTKKIKINKNTHTRFVYMDIILQTLRQKIKTTKYTMKEEISSNPQNTEIKTF